jgi:hypothetical protein
LQDGDDVVGVEDSQLVACEHADTRGTVAVTNPWKLPPGDLVARHQ